MDPIHILRRQIYIGLTFVYATSEWAVEICASCDHSGAPYIIKDLT